MAIAAMAAPGIITDAYAVGGNSKTSGLKK